MFQNWKNWLPLSVRLRSPLRRQVTVTVDLSIGETTDDGYGDVDTLNNVLWIGGSDHDDSILGSASGAWECFSPFGGDDTIRRKSASFFNSANPTWQSRQGNRKHRHLRPCRECGFNPIGFSVSIVDPTRRLIKFSVYPKPIMYNCF